MTRWGVTMITALVLVAGCGGGDANKTNTAATTTPPGPPGQAAGLRLEQDYERVVKTVLPSVVQIDTDTGLGSGVVYDNKGDIITNAHVVAGANRFTVTTATGKKALPATLVGQYAPDDLAVVRVNGASLRPARFGDSSRVAVGEIVLAMGNPLGLSGSVTSGIISAVGRTVSSQREGAFPGATIAGAVQTSAPINPGNSGGALVTLQNEVIGIPALAATDPQIGGAAAGIGFAIPSNTVKLIADQLIKSGRVTNSGRAALGVTVRDVADLSGNVVGVGVVSVTRDGPADKAGIRTNDIIVSLNGTKTPSTSDLSDVLAVLKPGQVVPIVVQHPDGTKTTARITLGELPG
ncbi:S1C family serine protease [Actinoallomurus rhizosphaericola]|uniref:S1C family serine protease n=1 Tax=Actinoallomurus rhizosphaericola TaxID=2952536 RepID=UPI002093F0FB|nr:trypsin-like peptidase domain-containing protein [Actinoallomurus rhizosphaericola]MCO5996411.1 trypsin-like peptidase domain-containing protein [Actinoallomurus rhizosphaericola]